MKIYFGLKFLVMAKQCLDEQESGLIYTLIDLQVEFLNSDKRIFGWIESQKGGWVSYFVINSIYLVGS